MHFQTTPYLKFYAVFFFMDHSNDQFSIHPLSTAYSFQGSLIRIHDADQPRLSFLQQLPLTLYERVPRTTRRCLRVFSQIGTPNGDLQGAYNQTTVPSQLASRNVQRHRGSPDTSPYSQCIN